MNRVRKANCVLMFHLITFFNFRFVNYSISEPHADELLRGSFCLLHKYIQLLCCHVSQVLVQAHNYANTADRFPRISHIIEQELPTVLLPEFITSLLLLHTRIGLGTELSTVFPVLRDLLELLDKFNKLAPNIALEDSEDLAWPGGLGKSRTERIVKIATTRMETPKYLQSWQKLLSTARA